MLVRQKDAEGEEELLPWQREWVVKGELFEIYFMLAGALCVGWGMYAAHAMLGWNLLRDKQGKPEAEGLYLFFAIFFSVAGFWPARDSKTDWTAEAGTIREGNDCSEMVTAMGDSDI